MNDNVYITLTLLYNTTQENENIQIHSLLEKIGITYKIRSKYYIEVRKTGAYVAYRVFRLKIVKQKLF